MNNFDLKGWYSSDGIENSLKRLNNDELRPFGKEAVMKLI